MTTPNRFFICGRNMADSPYGAFISGSSAPLSAQFPLSNMQRTSRARVYRTSDTALEILLSFAGGVSSRLNFVHLSRFNFSAAATWEAYGYASYDATGAALANFNGNVPELVYDASTLGELDFGVEPLGASIFDGFKGQMHATRFFMENTDVVNSVKIIVNDTNPSGYNEIGRVYVGRGIELAYNPATLTIAWNEKTEQKRTEGATLLSDGSVPYRKMKAEIGWVNAAQRAELMDLMREAGMRHDLFVSARSEAGGEETRDTTGIYRLKSLPDLSTVFYNVWKTTLDLEES
jgi:hypothetical protein